MLTRLTLAGNSCNRGNPAGDHSMSGKGQETCNHRHLTGQSKMRMVNAKLREPQTWNLLAGDDTLMVNVSSDVKTMKIPNIVKGPLNLVGWVVPAASSSLHWRKSR